MMAFGGNRGGRGRCLRGSGRCFNAAGSDKGKEERDLIRNFCLFNLGEDIVLISSLICILGFFFFLICCSFHTDFQKITVLNFRGS